MYRGTLLDVMVLTRHCVTQSAASMNSVSIIAKNLSMVDGGITAYGSDDRIVGVSQELPNENGFLSFLLPARGAGASPAKVYFELVSFESLSFFVTGSESLTYVIQTTFSFPQALMVNGIVQGTSCV